MRARAVQIILKRCLGHRDGEPVLVVTDPAMEPFARAFQRHAQALGAATDLLSTSPRRSHGEEPSKAVAEALRGATIAVLLTSLVHLAPLPTLVVFLGLFIIGVVVQGRVLEPPPGDRRPRGPRGG